MDTWQYPNRYMKLPLIAIEIAVAFGVPLAWAVWQLLSVRRELRQDREKATRQNEATTAVESSEHKD